MRSIFLHFRSIFHSNEDTKEDTKNQTGSKPRVGQFIFQKRVRHKEEEESCLQIIKTRIVQEGNFVIYL
jgi:hypothetical protein